MAEPMTDTPPMIEEPQKGEKAERGRSRIEWPYFSLEEACKLARGIHELGGNCQIDQLAGHLHQSAAGGGFRLKVQAARTFGLVNFKQGNLSLTDLGSQIIEPDSDREARALAFLTVPLYSALYEQFKGKTLPGPVGLELAMVNLGVAIKQKDKARQAFQRSAKEAGFFDFGSTKLVYPVLPIPTQDRSTKDLKNGDPAIPPPAPKPRTGGNDGNGGGDDLHPFIQGLLKTLPKPETEWPLEGRRKWLQSALSIFDVIYQGADGGGILSVRIEKDSAK